MPNRRTLLWITFVLVGLSMWALIEGSGIPREIVELEPGAERSDESLYQRTADRVADGDGYYGAAVAEQSAAGYPVSPPPTLRLPTTTWLVAGLGPLAPWLLRVLIVASAAVAMIRLERLAPTRIEWVAATLTFAATVGVLAHPRAVLLAEAWAMCLLALGVLLWRRGRPLPSILLVLVATCFRELVAAALVVMALCAWRRDRREAAAWVAATTAFLLVYAAHWVAAARAARGVDAVATPGWLWLGGWPQVIDTVQFSSILRPLPFEVAVVVVPLALLGWCVVRGDLPRHVLAISVVYMTVFMVAGRPDTAYWGRLYAALLLPGLAFAPRAIALLIRGAERHCPVDESS